MTVSGGGDGRVRAWILVQADSPEEVASQLYRELGLRGGDDWVVVRADVVDYVRAGVVDYEYNIVVAVDAANQERLDYVFGRIQGQTGVLSMAKMQVRPQRQYPPAPHDAEGYITPGEFNAGHEKEIWSIRPGRQGLSPGFNPWG